VSLYSVRSLLILDSEGGRIAAKYYSNDFPTVKSQIDFEKNLFAKTHRANGTSARCSRSLPCFSSLCSTEREKREGVVGAAGVSRVNSV
jgi:hypothetical protein